MKQADFDWVCILDITVNDILRDATLIDSFAREVRLCRMDTALSGLNSWGQLLRYQ